MNLSIKPSIAPNIDQVAKKMLGTAKADSPSGVQSGFGELLAKQVEKVTNTALEAQNEIQKVQNGDDNSNLERTAFLMAKAESELGTAVQVRNKAVSAYQEIMNMQI